MAQVEVLSLHKHVTSGKEHPKDEKYFVDDDYAKLLANSGIVKIISDKKEDPNVAKRETK